MQCFGMIINVLIAFEKKVYELIRLLGLKLALYGY